MNYGQVKSQFQGLLNRRDITTSLIETFVQQAIARCQRDLRIPAMEKAKLVTIGTTYGGLIIPGDLLELISLEASDGIELSHVSAQEARLAERACTGIPREYARKGSKWFLGPKPAAGDTVRIDYFAEFDPLSADADTNILTKIAADLPIYGALSYACDYFLDDRAASFEARYQSILQELHDQADKDELSGNAVVGAAYSYPSDTD